MSRVSCPTNQNLLYFSLQGGGIFGICLLTEKSGIALILSFRRHIGRGIQGETGENEKGPSYM